MTTKHIACITRNTVKGHVKHFTLISFVQVVVSYSSIVSFV